MVSDRLRVSAVNSIRNAPPRSDDTVIAENKEADIRDSEYLEKSDDGLEEDKWLSSLSSRKLAGRTSSTTNNDYVSIQIRGYLNENKKFLNRVEGAVLGDRVSPKQLHRAMMSWNKGGDEAILEYINNQYAASSNAGKNIMSHPITVSPPRATLTYGTYGLVHATLLDVQCRVLLLQSFNEDIRELLPIINLSSKDTLSMGSMIRKKSNYIFLHTKLPMLERAVQATTVTTGAGLPGQIVLDNYKAIHSREKREIEPGTSNCCFEQAYRQLALKDDKVYRYLFSSDRVFHITFEGDSGMDAGGVFREGMTRIIEDLFSEHYTLLLPCPNAHHVVHINTEKYLPNPMKTDALALSMFEFIGKLMGVSLRVKLCLPFEFPSIIWKQIVGDTPTAEDLMAIDVITGKLLFSLRHTEDDNIYDQSSFAAKYDDKLKFVYVGSDGVERPMREGGEHTVVTYDTRLEYCDEMEFVRLKEFESQVAAISKGLGAIIPLHIIQLFSWHQLEVLVAGNPTFDIELWKANTEAPGVSSRALALFWKVMSSLSPKEQSGFVRFAWGRSRLPPAKDFKTKMKLTFAGKAKLPVAHTCFFSVELPEYETEEDMKHGLLTAIHYGASGVLLA